MAVALSDSHPTLYVVHGRANPETHLLIPVRYARPTVQYKTLKIFKHSEKCSEKRSDKSQILVGQDGTLDKHFPNI